MPIPACNYTENIINCTHNQKSMTEEKKGLLDIFRKKKPDDGTYHREAGSSAGDYYNTGVSCGDYGVFRITVQDVFSITGRGLS